MLNQERAEAEKKEMIYRIEQRAALEREEALKTQVVLTRYTQLTLDFLRYSD